MRASQYFLKQSKVVRKKNGPIVSVMRGFGRKEFRDHLFISLDI